MALFTDADLAGMLGDGGDFGTDMTVAGSPVSGILFSGHNEALGIDGTDPVVLVRSADVGGVTEGAAVVVPGTGSFTVGRVMPSGQGFTKLVLVVAG